MPSLVEEEYDKKKEIIYDDNMGVTTFHARMRIFAKVYAHQLSAAAFLCGFVVDNLALPRVDSFASVILVLVYLSVAAFTIACMGIIGERGKHPRLLSIAPFLPFLLQFVFGGLLSLIFVYYFRSASLLGGWLFLFLLAGMIVGNEFLINRYHRLELQMIVLFTLLFSVMIFFVPLVFHRFGIDTFILAGMVSVALVALFLSGLALFIPKVVRESRRIVVPGILGVFLFMSLLYVTNAIPPIPLALRSAGVFHLVMRDPVGNYLALGEHEPWYMRYLPVTPVYHRSPGSPVFVTSVVFAPTSFTASIVHNWQRYDDKTGEWVTESRIEFPISGGREEGFRGYSQKEAIREGKWRVLVETPRGQLLGQVTFKVVDVDQMPPLEEAAL